MKLFTTTEVRNDKERQITADMSRLDSVNDELVRKRKELSFLEQEFNLTLESQHEIWRKESSEYITKINDLKTQVEQLEVRKKSSLTPIETQIEELDKVSKIIDSRETSLKEKEEEFEEKVNLLEDKLTKVSEQEREADRIIKLQANAQKGIDLQKEQITKQARDLSETMQKSILENASQERKLKKLEVELSLKEKALSDKELKLIKIEQGFVERERAIKDKYETLQRSIKQYANKQ